MKVSWCRSLVYVLVCILLITPSWRSSHPSHTRTLMFTIVFTLVMFTKVLFYSFGHIYSVMWMNLFFILSFTLSLLLYSILSFFLSLLLSYFLSFLFGMAAMPFLYRVFFMWTSHSGKSSFWSPSMIYISLFQQCYISSDLH